MPYGFAGHIGIAKETTWGTAVGAADYFTALSESLDAVPDRFETKNIIGGFYEPDDEAGVVRVAGDVVAAAHPVSIGHFLKAAFGVSSPSTVLSGFLYNIDFTPQESDTASVNPLPAYTFEVFRDVTSSQQYDGCVLSQVEFSMIPNQDIRATAAFVGKASRNIAKTTPSFPGSPVAPFTFDTASVSIGGAGTTDLIEALTLTINNQLEGVPAMNVSTTVARVRRTGPVMISLGGTMEFLNITDRDRFINQTETAVTASVTRTDSFKMVVDMPRFVYSAYPLGQAGRDRNVVSFEGKARYHVGSKNALKITLTTTASNY